MCTNCIQRQGVTISEHKAKPPATTHVVHLIGFRNCTGMRAGRTSPVLNRTLTTLSNTTHSIFSDNVGGVTQLGQEWRSHYEVLP